MYFMDLSRYSGDSIVNTVVQRFIQRSEFGQKKYGVTLDRKDLKTADWIQHMQEELMDAILYLEKLKTTLASNEASSTQEAASMSEKE
uniref:Uncharacterized protein n=1 Tax=viral metagenome TaxID=1070528 RepID=A0A6C0LS83_9ZZZZ